MSLRSVLCLIVAVLLVPAAGRTQDAWPIPVFVTDVQVEPPPFLPPEQLEGIIGGTRRHWLDVSQQLEKQHGKRRNAWPPEALKARDDAEDAHTLAVARRDYQRKDATVGLADSVQHFIKGMDRFKEMILVANADEAALVVQVTGRRLKPPTDPAEYRYFTRFRLRPGGKMTGDRFLELTRDYTWTTYFSKLIARPADATGYVDLEGGSPFSWENSATSGRAILLQFIRERLAPPKKQ